MARSGGAPPRLIVRTLAVTFATVACVLVTVFAVLLFDVQTRVRQAVAERLDAGQRIFSTLEARRQRELRLQVEILAESPTLKAALDTYTTEWSGERGRAGQLRDTVQRELDKLADRFPADAITIVDAAHRTVATAGRLRSAWPVGYRLSDAAPDDEAAGDRVVTLPSGVFRALSVPLTLAGVPIGALYVATALDDGYAAQLSELSGAETMILFRQRVVGVTPGAPREEIAHLATHGLPAESLLTIGGEGHAVRRLFRTGDADFYAFSSIDRAAARATRDALTTLAWIAAGAFALAGLASFWLARTLSRPIDQLARSIIALREDPGLHGALVPTGSSRELDALAGTFNALIHSVAAAQEETRAAYVGAIRALAAALDARDPYTAGHSERVSAISVAAGRALGLPEEQLEVLRLGALLHDIGKIGIDDAVLRKPGRLTRAEFEIIKGHPEVGARILGQVPFLAPHLPIVELHHECPDGSGYPHGLRGEQIPLLPRIVHVADAFDAITSARAYRAARGTREAVAELWRWSGSQFDVEVVAALVRSLPSIAPVWADGEVAMGGPAAVGTGSVLASADAAPGLAEARR